jgi:hypothetical protein
MTTRKSTKPAKRTRDDARDRVALAAIGLEAEFAIAVDGHPAKPEAVFGSPTQIVRAPMMHRTGRSYHLPTGGAVYFDTGVIEIATPVVEIRRGCAARAGRSLWESIAFLRSELDAWEEREGHTVQLSGFSAHYNVSFDASANGDGRTVEMLAMLLTHILPMPVMLLAANRRSTGIGVRPRSNRIEVTADFTPDAALMIAAATVIVGIARDVMTWPSFALDELDLHGIPVVDDFVPEPHSSRNGWVARFSSFAENPFLADVNERLWTTRRGDRLSVRDIAARVVHAFWPSISRLGDARSLRPSKRWSRTPRRSSTRRPPAGLRRCRSAMHLTMFPFARSPVRATNDSSCPPLPVTGSVERRLVRPRERGLVAVLRRERDRTNHVFSLDSARASRRLECSAEGRFSTRDVGRREGSARTLIPADQCRPPPRIFRSARRSSHDDHSPFSDRPSPRGQTELSQLNPFDLVVLLLSNWCGTRSAANDLLIGGLAGATALLAINAIVVRVLFRFGKLDRLEGKPEALIHKGRLVRKHLDREMITVAELEAAARRQGIASLAHVDECRLETGGSLSFIERHPTQDEERHHESLGMLGQIESRQRAMLEQLTALERKIAGMTGSTP